MIEFPGFWGEKFVGLDGHRPFFCILMSDPEKERSPLVPHYLFHLCSAVCT